MVNSEILKLRLFGIFVILFLILSVSSFIFVYKDLNTKTLEVSRQNLNDAKENQISSGFLLKSLKSKNLDIENSIAKEKLKFSELSGGNAFFKDPAIVKLNGEIAKVKSDIQKLNSQIDGFKQRLGK